MIFLIILYFISSYLFNFQYFFKNHISFKFYVICDTILTLLSVLTVPIMIFLIFFNFGFMVFILYFSIGIIYAYKMNNKVLEFMKSQINEECDVEGIDIFIYIMVILTNILSPGAFYIWFALSKITFNNYFVSSFRKEFCKKEENNV